MNRQHPTPVAIVVLNWNGATDTIICLKSLEALTYANFRVIVVDNGSTDGSVPAIRAAFPSVELIETGRNLGFAGGNNVGIRYALDRGADYVLLLNNDTEVERSLLDALVAAACRFPEAGAFSGKIYFHADPHRIWYAGARWNEQTLRFDLVGEGLIDDGNHFSHTSETAYACGCALFLPAARLREIGLLDEDFFLYFEETDWCYRARAAGHPSIFVPEARLWHKVSVSFGGEGSPLALYFITRNRLLWARRHAMRATRLRIYRATLRSLLLRIIAPVKCHPRAIKAWWWALRSALDDPNIRATYLGFRDFWLGRFGDCPPAVRRLVRRDGTPSSQPGTSANGTEAIRKLRDKDERFSEDL